MADELQTEKCSERRKYFRESRPTGECHSLYGECWEPLQRSLCLEKFREAGSRCPGHPEYGLTPGVETTTGPLGQGFANGVGMAIAEAFLAATFNKPNHKIVDHYIYAIVSDGDLMEGISDEAASMAGHMKLGKLIYLYVPKHGT